MALIGNWSNDPRYLDLRDLILNLDDGSSNGTDGNPVDPDVPDRTLLIVMECLIVLIMLVGIPGNLLVIVVILLHRRLRTSAGLLIIALNSSDVIYYSVVLPLRMASFHNATWLWGDTLCRFVD